MMKKYICACLAALLMVIVSASLVSAAGEGEERSISIVEMAEMPQEKADEAHTDPVEILEGLDTEEILSSLQKLYDLYESESFQKLLKYPEFVDFLKELVIKGAEFARSEKEVTVKILTALELSEKEISLLMLLLDTSEDVVREVREFAESDEGRKMISFAEENLDEGQLADFLSELLSAIK